MLTLLEELMIGAFIMVLENGEVIDTDPVAIDSLPDDVPEANWTDWRIGIIERVKITPVTKQRPKSVPQITGGYDETPGIITTGWIIEAQIAQYSEFIHRLGLGAPAKIVSGTAFTPFKKGTDHKITGWTRIEAKHETGTTKINLIDWMDMRLTTNPDWKSEPGKPIVQFTVLGDDNGGLSTCVVNAEP
jgi:hypothetical protein